MRYYHTILFCLFALFCFAQEGKTKHHALKSTIDSLSKIDADSVNLISKQLLLIEEQIAEVDSLVKRGFYYRQTGIIMYRKSNFHLAEKMFTRSLKNFKLAGDEINQAKLQSNIAVVKELRGRYNDAVELYLEALKIFEKHQLIGGLSFVYNNLGVLYEEMRDAGKALKYTRKALSAKQQLNDSTGIASTFNNMGVLFEELLFMPDSAIYYYSESAEIYRAKHDELNYALTTNNIGFIYSYEGKYQKAKEKFGVALTIFIRLNNKSGESATLRNFGDLYLKMNNFKNAEIYLKKALNICKSTENLKMKIEITGLLAELYEKSKQNKHSISLYKQYIALNDSLINIENKKHLDELEKRYETEKKEQQLELLNKENLIQKQKIAQQNMYLFFFIMLSLFILLTGILVFRQIKLKNRYKTSMLEHKMLRSQLNPHFIFNALQAIQNFLFKNDKLETADFLADFARLMRNILEGSREETITLKKEVDIIENYIKLQHLRFNGRFDYKLIIDNSIDVEIIKVPPMLIQPFVENAIEHGIRALPDNIKGRLIVKYQNYKGKLNIIVEDNGVGIGNIKAETNHKSYATQITKERINAIRQTHHLSVNYSVENIDKHNENPGTKVKFEIPLAKK